MLTISDIEKLRNMIFQYATLPENSADNGEIDALKTQLRRARLYVATQPNARHTRHTRHTLHTQGFNEILTHSEYVLDRLMEAEMQLRVQNRAARTIQRNWTAVRCNPYHPIGRKCILSDFHDLLRMT